MINSPLLNLMVKFNSVSFVKSDPADVIEMLCKRSKISRDVLKDLDARINLHSSCHGSILANRLEFLVWSLPCPVAHPFFFLSSCTPTFISSRSNIVDKYLETVLRGTRFEVRSA